MEKSYFQSPKIEKDATRLFSKYLEDFDLFKVYLPEATYSGLREEILAHITEKTEKSASKTINYAEAKSILETLGSVQDLVKDFNVPKLIELPFLGSTVGYRQLGVKLLQGAVIIALLSGISVAVRNLYLTITTPEGRYSNVSQEELRSKWTITKGNKAQELEIIFPAKNMRTVYVYHGRDLKDEEVFIQFTGSPNYKLKTTTEKTSNPYGKMIVEIYSEQEEPSFPVEYDAPEDVDTSLWSTGFQELIVFVPEQLNFKGTFTPIPDRAVPSEEPKYSLTELYLEKGITPYITPHRNEYESNTLFGYVERIKNAEKIKITLGYLGEYVPTPVSRN